MKKDLKNQYDKIKLGSGGRVMTDLKQFYEEEAIKDFVHKNTSDKSKIEFLNIYHDKIMHFSKINNIKIKLLDFYDFTKK